MNQIDLDDIAFFSEHSISQWMDAKREQTKKIGKQLLKILIIIIVGGNIFSVMIALTLFKNPIILLIIILLEIIYFFIFVFATFSSLSYYFKEMKEQRVGIWFMETKCNCKSTFEKITKNDAIRFQKDKLDKIIRINGEPEKCKRCQRHVKIKRVMIKRPAPRSSLNNKNNMDNMN